MGRNKCDIGKGINELTMYLHSKLIWKTEERSLKLPNVVIKVSINGIVSQKTAVFINNTVNTLYHTMKTVFNDCEKNIKTHLPFKHETYS